MKQSIFLAVCAAALFGISTPLAKLLIDSAPPLLLGGLLYVGSGVGLALVRLLRDRGWRDPAIPAGQWPWLLGAIVSGGVLGPVALLFGLAQTSAATASLLLNLEAVLTAVIAWVVFRENADRRVVAGMFAIVLGGLVLSWPGQLVGQDAWSGPAMIAVACACWAIDNNLTRKVAVGDALFIAGSKGLVAGLVNCALALGLGMRLPETGTLAAILTVGFLGYGISLTLFVLALRGLGAARTGAWFSTAPFLGAFFALLLPGESAGPAFWLACALMLVGVWLHLTERHQHLHTHEPIEHTHRHSHDMHHQHEHDFPWHGEEPHTHRHRHAAITHSHPHYPDVHHQHSH